jgi:hypothetical protein
MDAEFGEGREEGSGAGKLDLLGGMSHSGLCRHFPKKTDIDSETPCALTALKICS